MPFCGLSQNAGAVCELPESDTSTFWPTFCADRPICCSRVRSICRLTAGASKRWCTCTSTAPGICRIFFTSSAASAALAAMLLPVNWTSIAAGRPKLRIWVTMSAGWKKNSIPGKRFGSSRRRTVTNSSVGRWPFFSDSRISPSSVPIVPALLYERLMPLFGTPRLSRMVSSWSLGTSSRIAASTSSARRAVSSIRVPVAARRCRRIWPASTRREEVAAEHRIEAAGQQAEGEEGQAEDAALGEQRRRAARCRRRGRARSGGRRRGRRAAAGSAARRAAGTPSPCEPRISSITSVGTSVRDRM